MFGLNPIVLYLILALAASNVVTGIGWKLAASRADKAKQQLVLCEDRFQAFRDETEALGKKHAAGIVKLIEVSDAVNTETKAHYEQNLARSLADLDRLRKQYASVHPGSGPNPPVSRGPSRIADIPADCIPLAEQSAVTTAQVFGWQDWYREQKDKYETFRREMQNAEPR